MIKTTASTLHLKGEFRSSGFSAWQPYDAQFISSSSSEGSTHSGWRDKMGAGDVGGAWFMSKVSYECSPLIMNNNLVRGPMWQDNANGFVPSGSMTNTVAELQAKGTKAISYTLPTNPMVDFSVTIGEMRAEGLPSVVGTGILKEKARFLKGSGSEYLNVEFGWKPLISDLKKFARSVKDHEKIIHGYKAGSDKKIRRRFAYPTQIAQRTMSAQNQALKPLNTIAIVGNVSTSELLETHEWFSGAFRYHVPMGDDLISRFRRYSSEANKLLGLRLTPEVVWNLQPWSWAADWFADTGTILHNISALGNDGMAMQYGYMMKSTKKEVTTTFNTTGSSPSGYFRKTEITKRRLPASPFSFYTTFDGLSTRQQAICAALGITRVR